MRYNMTVTAEEYSDTKRDGLVARGLIARKHNHRLILTVKGRKLAASQYEIYGHSGELIKFPRMNGRFEHPEDCLW